MKITVLGATGGVGTEVVKQALDRGWDVTAVVRDPAKLTLPARVVVAGMPACCSLSVKLRDESNADGSRMSDCPGG
ncbi:NAD(P)H-binding protein, partial [Amycolatopsis sp. NPDC005961]|uniref:NAD(P)H-binding protein n=1 Tax=Amycolatopsis sp. NPDC005961 TaxID=3156720 RepID=UPI0033DB5CD8